MPTSKKESPTAGIYQVERILAERYNSKKMRKEYLLKWENFGDEENTWEPEENLECDQLIKEFQSKKKVSKSRKRSTSRNLAGNTLIEAANVSLPDHSGTSTSNKSKSRKSSFSEFDEIPAPAEGESLMEKGVKPLEIIGSCVCLLFSECRILKLLVALCCFLLFPILWNKVYK